MCAAKTKKSETEGGCFHWLSCSFFRCWSTGSEANSNVQMAARQQPEQQTMSGTGTRYHPLTENINRSGRKTSGQQLHDRIALQAALQAARDRHKQRQAKQDETKAQAGLRKS